MKRLLRKWASLNHGHDFLLLIGRGKLIFPLKKMFPQKIGLSQRVYSFFSNAGINLLFGKETFFFKERKTTNFWPNILFKMNVWWSEGCFLSMNNPWPQVLHELQRPVSPFLWEETDCLWREFLHGQQDYSHVVVLRNLPVPGFVLLFQLLLLRSTLWGAGTETALTTWITGTSGPLMEKKTTHDKSQDH